MERFRVVGGARLDGEVRVTGAKNSVLKTMAAALLAEGRSTLTEVPHILDVEIMGELLRRLGCTVDYDPAAATVAIDVPAELGHQADYDLVRRIRASICVLGPLLARCGQAEVAMPGGDAIGTRPLDFHMAGLTKLGAELDNEHGYIVGRAPKGLTGASVWLDFPSVGATEQILMASVLAKGTTVIDNAAREPEISDLCSMLIAMGAHIEGHGSSTIVVHGVEPGDLRAVRHDVVADRIQAATYIAATAITGGEVVLRGARAEHMETLLRRFREMGLLITDLGGSLAVWAPTTAEARLHSIDVATLPYPGIATDYKPLITTMLSVADGVGIVTENLYPGRFRYVEELQRLGADIRTDGHHAVVRGVSRLSGAPVRAPDIRAGAALVVAGLAAEGSTVVSGVHHVDRGYDDLVGRLRSLGADITRQ